MVPAHEVSLDQTNWNYLQTIPEKNDRFDKFTLKGSQFRQPLVEFNGACAGCGETPYIKLVTQLFGDRMYIGNAAGCSSAISGGAPLLPYCKDCQGHGPAWEHSLFEDNAEFAYGFFHAQDSIRKELLIRLEAIKAADSADPAAVLAALPNVTCEGITGSISFNDIGDANRDSAVVKKCNTETADWDFVTVAKVS